MCSHYICRTLHAHLHVKARMHLHHSGIWLPVVQPQSRLKMQNGTGASKCSLGRTGYCNPLMQPRTNRLLQR
jgi:hypothetical protein